MSVNLDQYLDSIGDWLDTPEQFEAVKAAWTPEFEPTYENGFAVAGLDCVCDEEYRCRYHDRDAEYAYWLGQYSGTRPALPLDTEAEYADRVYDDSPYKYGGIPA